jgi:DNA polymerase III alpha subunit
LAQRSHELGYSSCAITDSNTLAGAIRFDRAARSAGVTPVFGSELTLLSDEPDDHVVVLARYLEGYRNLCRLVTCAQAHGRVHSGLTLEQLALDEGDPSSFAVRVRVVKNKLAPPEREALLYYSLADGTLVEEPPAMVAEEPEEEQWP